MFGELTQPRIEPETSIKTLKKPEKIATNRNTKLEMLFDGQAVKQRFNLSLIVSHLLVYKQISYTDHSNTSGKFGDSLHPENLILLRVP